MVSILLAILAGIGSIAAISGAVFVFWEPIMQALNWAQTLGQQLFDFIPTWLYPFAAVLLVLSIGHLGVKLL